MRTLTLAKAATPAATSHKFSRGMVLVFAGPMPGAAGLASAAALRAGAGDVVLEGSERAPLGAIISESDARFDERLSDPRVGAVVIGPGFPAGDALLFDVEVALDSGKALVLDAAAIGAALPRLCETPVRAILTPHELSLLHI